MQKIILVERSKDDPNILKEQELITSGIESKGIKSSMVVANGSSKDKVISISIYCNAVLSLIPAGLTFIPVFIFNTIKALKRDQLFENRGEQILIGFETDLDSLLAFLLKPCGKIKQKRMNNHIKMTSFYQQFMIKLEALKKSNPDVECSLSDTVNYDLLIDGNIIEMGTLPFLDISNIQSKIFTNEQYQDYLSSQPFVQRLAEVLNFRSIQEQIREKLGRCQYVISRDTRRENDLHDKTLSLVNEYSNPSSEYLKTVQALLRSDSTSSLIDRVNYESYDLVAIENERHCSEQGKINQAFKDEMRDTTDKRKALSLYASGYMNKYYPNQNE